MQGKIEDMASASLQDWTSTAGQKLKVRGWRKRDGHATIKPVTKAARKFTTSATFSEIPCWTRSGTSVKLIQAISVMYVGYARVSV